MNISTKPNLNAVVGFLRHQHCCFCQHFDNSFIKLNPDFKLKRLSNGRVEMSAVQNGEAVKLQFEDVYADLLMAAYRKHEWRDVNTISKKYYFPTRNVVVK